MSNPTKTQLSPVQEAEPLNEELSEGDGEVGDFLEQKGENAILGQEEIDSLLGLHQHGPDRDSKAAVRTIVRSGSIVYDRLPMLEVVFNQLVRMLVTSLRNFTSDNVEASLDGIVSVRFSEYIRRTADNSLTVVFKAEEWDNLGLLNFDTGVVEALLGSLLGGQKGEVGESADGQRTFTNIERGLITRIARVFLTSLSESFDPLTQITFRYERLESSTQFTQISRQESATVLAAVKVVLADRTGYIRVAFPYATLEPVRELLLQMFVGEKLGRDTIWEEHLTSELWQAKIDIQVIASEFRIPLGKTLAWKPGTFLPLGRRPEDPVEIRCGNVPLFKAEMGQKEEKIAVCLQNRTLK